MCFFSKTYHLISLHIVCWINISSQLNHDHKNRNHSIEHWLDLNQNWYYICLSKLDSLWRFLKLDVAQKVALKCQTLSSSRWLCLWSEWVRRKWVSSRILEDEWRNRNKWREKQKRESSIYSLLLIIFNICL